MFVNCVAEESSGACLHISDIGHVMWVGGEISNTNWEMGTSPLVSFYDKPEGVQFVGTLFTRTETVGEGPCINLAELGEGYRFTGVINHEHTSKAIEGTWPENGEVDLVVYGKTSTKSIRRLGGGWSAGTLGTHAIQKTGALVVGARSAGLGTQLRGQIEAEKEITAGSTIWTLPEGLRPSSALELPALLNATMVVLKISTGGVVTCSAAMKEKEVLKLDGLMFDLA